MAQNRVTIKQVAAAAGVSITTVSHVLNEVPGKRIHPETRERVLAEAARLGYAPNMLAQSLRTQRSHTIGLIGDEIATTPFAGKIILGAQDVATAHDSVVFVVNTGYEREVENREIDALLRRQVDGILYAAMYHRPVELPAKLAGVPTVLINASCADPAVPWVVPDEAAGGEDAAEALLSAGHRRLAFVNDVDDIPAAFGREEGFRRRAAAWGVPQEDLRVVAAEADPEGGYQAAVRLLDEVERPTGIFCFNDRMAMGVYRAAAELDLRVPSDVSIVGFDNQDFIADGLHPGLTTVELPHYDMGVWAAEQLFEQIASGRSGHPAPTKRLRGPVIHRNSVAPPSRGSALGERHHPIDRRGNA
ncbi:substrate-binding domain-containing protein [Agromyces sp. CFH 90414]|uniref:Substrate-binding domain-containing protein n=1 Tax=Agromyces agglutinans TaxID=2662258 RepID=A0A6I2F8Z9_9MICO|nr:LacI family DNA-binding transcriptional regulator [Agromyces agglutinans]MRG60714.1 substrate-binding domain-containing protein [Agromyces agglutinans]